MTLQKTSRSFQIDEKLEPNLRANSIFLSLHFKNNFLYLNNPNQTQAQNLLLISANETVERLERKSKRGIQWNTSKSP